MIKMELSMTEQQREPIRIEIRIERQTVRRVLMLGGFLVGLVGVGVAIALPVTFSDGEVLTAKQLNDSFMQIDSRLTALESHERILRGNINRAGTEYPDWISKIVHSSTGSYEIHFAPGVFSDTPTCVANSNEGFEVPPVFGCFNAFATGITCVPKGGTSGTVAVDSAFFLLCSGPM
jgi:hypothetical protein